MFRLLQLSIAKESMNRYFNGIGSRSSSTSSTVGSKSRSGSASTAYLAPSCKANMSSSVVDPELLRYIMSPTASATLSLRSSATLKSPPMKFEEDVIVMDAILVNNNKKNIRRNNSLSELKSVVNNHVLVMDELLMSKNNSSGNFRNSNSSARNNLAGFNSAVSDLGDEDWKRELCMTWMENGRCRFGSKCQFAHGKEELRGDFRENRICKHKSEVSGISGSKALSDAGFSSKLHRSSPSPGPKSPNPYLSPYPSPVVIKKTVSKSKCIQAISSMPKLSASFNWPPTKEEEERITRALYGPPSGKRLPVFEQICPQ